MTEHFYWFSWSIPDPQLFGQSAPELIILFMYVVMCMLVWMCLCEVAHPGGRQWV